MCLISLAFGIFADFPIVLLGNRDEFFARPTSPLARWSDQPLVFGGRDLERGGGWLGLTGSGRFAAVTNLRHPEARKEGASRGALVADYLRGQATAADYAQNVAGSAEQYASFNLLVGDPTSAYYIRDSAGGVGVGSVTAHRLTPGIWTLSNGRLGEQWPKVQRLEQQMAAAAQAARAPEPGFLDWLANTALAPDGELPATGVPLELERRLSAAFVLGAQYGTRASTLAAVGLRGGFMIERSFGPMGVPTVEVRLSLDAENSAA
jgi:uncharacterized protein with NRDE domain